MYPEHQAYLRDEGSGVCVAFCPICGALAEGETDPLEVELRVKAHRRVTRSTESPGNEVLAASRELGNGLITEGYFELLSEERKLWNESPHHP